VINLAVALGNVRMDHEALAVGDALHLEELVTGQHVGSLGAKHDRDPPVGGAVPMAGKGDGSVYSRLAAGRIQGIEVADLPIGHATGWESVDSGSQSRADAELSKGLRPARDRSGIVPHCGGAGLESFQDVEATAG